MKTLFRTVCMLWLGWGVVAVSQADDYSGVFLALHAGPSVYADDDMYRYYALDDDDVAWSLQAGYRINKWVSVEAAYTDLGRYRVTDFIGWGTGPYQGSNRFRDATLSATGYFPFGPGFAAYARLGAGVIKVDGDRRWLDDSGLVTVFAAGMEWTPPQAQAITLRVGFESHGFAVEQKVLRTFGGTTFFYEEDYQQAIGLFGVGLRVNF